MNLLKKWFIKDYEQVEEPSVRRSYGLVASLLGLFLNLLLVIGKLITGFISGSISLIADGLNNLSDMGTAGVAIVGFTFSSKPADEKHPYGHERIEQISALIVSLIVFAIGALLFKTSIDKIIKPSTINVSIATYIVLILGIGAKIIQSAVNYNFAKHIGSGTLKAVGADSRNDILATTAVIISMLVAQFAKVNIDGYAGIFVSLFILASSISLIKETINPLIGVKPDQDLVNQLKSMVEAYDDILGVHDIMMHLYGKNTAFVVAHVEVPIEKGFAKMHELINTIEREIEENLKIHLTLHMDPIETTNPKVENLKARCTSILEEKYPCISLHGFRINFKKSHNEILFDLLIPFNSKANIEEVEDILKKEFENEETPCKFIIETDKDYV